MGDKGTKGESGIPGARGMAGLPGLDGMKGSKVSTSDFSLFLMMVNGTKKIPLYFLTRIVTIFCAKRKKIKCIFKS